MPSGVAAAWLTFTSVPTVVLPSSSSPATLPAAVFSMGCDHHRSGKHGYQTAADIACQLILVTVNFFSPLMPTCIGISFFSIVSKLLSANLSHAAHIRLRGFGIATEPSSRRLFSRDAISIRGVQQRCCWRVRSTAPSGFSLLRTRMPGRRAMCVAKVGAGPTSVLLLAQRPCLYVAGLDLGVSQIASSTRGARTGISIVRRKKSTVFCHSLSYHILLSSGLQTTTISCFSNW